MMRKYISLQKNQNRRIIKSIIKLLEDNWQIKIMDLKGICRGRFLTKNQKNLVIN